MKIQLNVRQDRNQLRLQQFVQDFSRMFVDPLAHLLIILRRDVVEAFRTTLRRAEPDLSIRGLPIDHVGAMFIADLHSENAVLWKRE